MFKNIGLQINHIVFHKFKILSTVFELDGWILFIYQIHIFYIKQQIFKNFAYCTIQETRTSNNLCTVIINFIVLLFTQLHVMCPKLIYILFHHTLYLDLSKWKNTITIQLYQSIIEVFLLVLRVFRFFLFLKN